MNKQTRTYEEIITLQDKAIEALTQANAALVMAIEALKKARAEHGFATQLPGLGQGFVGMNTWGGGFQTTGLMTVSNTDKTLVASSLMDLVQADAAAYQR